MIFIVVNCRVAVFENIFKQKGRKKMKKRFLALLLALVMVVALLPTIALAADSGNTLQFSTDLRPEYSATQSQRSEERRVGKECTS